jgi:hypothetical protein
MRFYASGITPTHDNKNPKRHAAAWADRKRRSAIARAMFKGRFPEIEVEKYAVPELRGMEGIRVRTFYAQLGLQYGVTWKGRDYDKSNWNIADDINRSVSAATASLYALCSAVITSMGYLPQLGFIHEGGTDQAALQAAVDATAEVLFQFRTNIRTSEISPLLPRLTQGSNMLRCSVLIQCAFIGTKAEPCQLYEKDLLSLCQKNNTNGEG